MEKSICPICHDEMKRTTTTEMRHPSSTPYDFECRHKDDHTYFVRFIQNEEGSAAQDPTISKIKTRLFSNSQDNMIFLMDYQLNQLQIWTRRGQTNRVTIPIVFDPDFSDLDKLREKLRTYLVFA